MSEVKLLPCPVLKSIAVLEQGLLDGLCSNCPNRTAPDYEALLEEVEK